MVGNHKGNDERICNEMPQQPYSRNRLRGFLRQDIDTSSHVFEAQLLLLAVAVGIQDAVAFPNYHCFASNQTGNTVLLAVGDLSLNISGCGAIFSLQTTAISLSLFVAGTFCNGQVANVLQARASAGGS